MESGDRCYNRRHTFPLTRQREGGLRVRERERARDCNGQGKILRVDFEQETGLGTLSHRYEIEDTNPLEPGAKSRKVIAPLVGVAIDDDLMITRFVMKKLRE